MQQRWYDMEKKLLAYGRHSNERIAYRLGKILEKEQNQCLEVYKWRLSYPNNFDLLLRPLRMLETFLIKILKRPTCLYDLHQTRNTGFKPVTAISPDWETIKTPSEWVMTEEPRTNHYSIEENISGIFNNMFGKIKVIEVVERDASNVSDSELGLHRNNILDVIYNRPNPNIF